MKVNMEVAKTVSDTYFLLQGSQETDPDEEMGLVGAVADDTEAEYIRYVCENEILSNDNLLGMLK